MTKVSRDGALDAASEASPFTVVGVDISQFSSVSMHQPLSNTDPRARDLTVRSVVGSDPSPSVGEGGGLPECSSDSGITTIETGTSGEAQRTLGGVLPYVYGTAVSETFSIPTVVESASYQFIKRAMDVVGATAGIILFSPLMVLCAILIKFQDGGPILFRQIRVGKRGGRFEIVKFRSMVVHAEAMQSQLSDLNEHDDNRTFKILNDPRMTPVGRFMRRLSLDEIPQLWNVLRGEMTLVGPRPALPKEVALYDSAHLMRVAVTPGLTCIWQVSGRSRLGFERQMEMDIDYIRRRNVWLDLKLIFKTVPAVLFGDGAA